MTVLAISADFDHFADFGYFGPFRHFGRFRGKQRFQPVQDLGNVRGRTFGENVDFGHFGTFDHFRRFGHFGHFWGSWVASQEKGSKKSPYLHRTRINLVSAEMSKPDFGDPVWRFWGILTFWTILSDLVISDDVGIVEYTLT